MIIRTTRFWRNGFNFMSRDKNNTPVSITNSGTPAREQLFNTLAAHQCDIDWLGKAATIPHETCIIITIIVASARKLLTHCIFSFFIIVIILFFCKISLFFISTNWSQAQ
jgi:hypothetical protein